MVAEIARNRYALEPYIGDFARFPEATGKRVLKIGVGAGSDFANWRRHAGHATGVDLTEAGIALTAERLALEGVPPGRYTLRTADAEALPFADGSFDIVYSWGVLHHTGAMHAAIARATGLVGKSGLFAFALYRKTRLCWLST